MFTEKELSALILHPKVKESVQNLKNKFIEEEAPFMEISDHDFLALMLLTPSVGIALADDSITLFEEIALNKKARKYSKGGYFLKKDPVVDAMKHLIKDYDRWGPVFLEQLRIFIEDMVDKKALMQSKIDEEGTTDEEYLVEVLQAPFLFIRFVSSFLSNSEDEDFAARRKVSQKEYDRIVDILKRIDIIDIPLVRKHLSKYVVK
ncbi:MAG TPA: hypothetical protein ENJ39_08255 [Flammeovirgaceae bacterium]|nr:hypothetical protein [Flammeovirgaceae bacterium]